MCGPARARPAFLVVRTAVSIAILVAITAWLSGCSTTRTTGPYGTQMTRYGSSLQVLGWDIVVSEPRFEGDYVLVDVSAAAEDPTDPTTPRTAAAELRFGVYGTPAHPVEATGIGSCDPELASDPLSAPVADRLTGTVCLGPLREQSAVRGIYVYAPSDRIPGSTVAYAASFPVGVAPASPTDTGLVLRTKGVAAWRADGIPLTPESLGDDRAFTGDGSMRIDLTAEAPARQYREASVARGGPMMLLAGPAVPITGPGRTCDAGSSVLLLPDASLGAVHVSASLCTHGEINAAVLYASVSVAGTHAAVWTAS